MKRFGHIIILLSMLCLSSQALRGQVKKGTLTAMAFYNLENLYDTEDDPFKYDEAFTPKGANHYTKEIYQQKLHNLAFVIKQLAAPEVSEGPAVIGVAEVENDKVLRDLLDQPELTGRGYRFAHFDGPDARGIDVGLIYRPAMFKILTARSLPVNLKLGGDEGVTRDILFVQGILAGDTVFIMVNHWPSRRGSEAATASKRAIAAGVCRRVADSIMQINQEARIIIMGDLNDDPVDVSVVRVIRAKGRVQLAPDEFFNPWVRLYREGTGTLAYNDSWSLFDQILVSRSFLLDTIDHWKFDKAEVFNKAFLKSTSGQYKGYPHRSFDGETWINGYSDHFPTIIYLKRKSNSNY